MTGSCNIHTSKRDTVSAASEYKGIYSILRQKYSACTGRADLILTYLLHGAESFLRS